PFYQFAGGQHTSRRLLHAPVARASRRPVTAPDGSGTYRRQRATGYTTDFSICRRAARSAPPALCSLTRARAVDLSPHRMVPAPTVVNELSGRPPIFQFAGGQLGGRAPPLVASYARASRRSVPAPDGYGTYRRQRAMG